jgi:hypothetical protein
MGIALLFKQESMKKIFLGAALFLVLSAAQVSAAGRAPQNGQPRDEHNILSSQLPSALLTDIKKDYSDYWITQLSEEGRGKHPDYFLTLENADQIVHLRSSDASNWVVTSTSVKTD